MPGITLAGRGAVHYARITLQDCGYEIERITGSGRSFDLIAWKKDTLLFLVIRTARVPGIAGFSDEVLNLSLMVHRHEIPGEIQLWVYHPGGLSRYLVLAGGAILITGRAL